MNAPESSRPWLLWALALALGIGISVGERLVFAAALARPFQLTILAVPEMSVLLAALPFLALALRASKRVWPWLFALAATTAVRGWWVAAGIAYQRSSDNSGVNLQGVYLILLSPFVITILTIIIDRLFGQPSKVN